MPDLMTLGSSNTVPALGHANTYLDRIKIDLR